MFILCRIFATPTELKKPDIISNGNATSIEEKTLGIDERNLLVAALEAAVENDLTPSVGCWPLSLTFMCDEQGLSFLDESNLIALMTEEYKQSVENPILDDEPWSISVPTLITDNAPSVTITDVTLSTDTKTPNADGVAPEVVKLCSKNVAAPVSTVPHADEVWSFLPSASNIDAAGSATSTDITMPAPINSVTTPSLVNAFSDEFRSFMVAVLSADGVSPTTSNILQDDFWSLAAATLYADFTKTSLNADVKESMINADVAGTTVVNSDVANVNSMETTLEADSVVPKMAVEPIKNCAVPKATNNVLLDEFWTLLTAALDVDKGSSAVTKTYTEEFWSFLAELCADGASQTVHNSLPDQFSPLSTALNVEGVKPILTNTFLDELWSFVTSTLSPSISEVDLYPDVAVEAPSLDAVDTIPSSDVTAAVLDADIALLSDACVMTSAVRKTLDTGSEMSVTTMVSSISVSTHTVVSKALSTSLVVSSIREGQMVTSSDSCLKNLTSVQALGTNLTFPKVEITSDATPKIPEESSTNKTVPIVANNLPDEFTTELNLDETSPTTVNAISNKLRLFSTVVPNRSVCVPTVVMAPSSYTFTPTVAKTPRTNTSTSTVTMVLDAYKSTPSVEETMNTGVAAVTAAMTPNACVTSSVGEKLPSADLAVPLVKTALSTPVSTPAEEKLLSLSTAQLSVASISNVYSSTTEKVSKANLTISAVSTDSDTHVTTFTRREVQNTNIVAPTVIMASGAFVVTPRAEKVPSKEVAAIDVRVAKPTVEIDLNTNITVPTVIMSQDAAQTVEKLPTTGGAVVSNENETISLVDGVLNTNEVASTVIRRSHVAISTMEKLSTIDSVVPDTCVTTSTTERPLNTDVVVPTVIMSPSTLVTKPAVKKVTVTDVYAATSSTELALNTNAALPTVITSSVVYDDAPADRKETITDVAPTVIMASSANVVTPKVAIASKSCAVSPTVIKEPGTNVVMPTMTTALDTRVCMTSTTKASSMDSAMSNVPVASRKHVMTSKMPTEDPISSTIGLTASVNSATRIGTKEARVDIVRSDGQPRQYVLQRNDESRTCNVCSKTFTREYDRRRHEKSVHGNTNGIVNDVSPCELCGRTFSGPYEKRRHEKNVHSGSRLAAENSEQMVGRIRELELRDICGPNVREVLEKRLVDKVRVLAFGYLCDRCGDEFSSKTMLARHLQAANGPCGLRSEQRELLDACSGGRFREHMAVHEAVATGAPRLPCQDCDKTFRSDRNRWRHANRVHGDTDGKKHEHKNPPETHEAAAAAVHGDDGHFVCDACGKAFRQRTSLNSHVRAAHKKEKTHACPHCNSAYFKRSKLLVHIKTHTGVRDVPCPNCPKMFSCRDNMVKHVKLVHAQTRDYKCTACDRAFKSSKHLVQHVLRLHKREPSTANFK